MKRREFLRLLGYGCAATAMPDMLGAAQRPAQRPNIILFMVDDMGWQDTSLPFWYGKDGRPIVTRLNRRYRTPNMEAMAREGVLFTQAYACPVCSPTRCSLMSGMNMARHRVTDWTLGVDQQDRLNMSGEGCAPPRWAANGLQPENTPASGRCRVPWTCDGFVPGQSSGTFRQGDEQDYAMTEPFVNALCFPKLLQEAGYYTIHCGKAHWGAGSTNWNTGKGPSTPGADPRNFGFDVNIAGSEVGGLSNYRNDSWFGNANGFSQMDTPDLAEYYGKTNAALTYYATDAEGKRKLPEDGPIFLTDALTDKALRAVKTHLDKDPGRPFYLYMAHYAVHTPLGNGQAWDASRSAASAPDADAENRNPGDTLVWNETNRNYAVLLKGMDDSLGTIRKFLKDEGVADNTVVIFMADNGGLDGTANGARFRGTNAPLRAGKGSCYEGGIREPLIVAGPGVAVNAVCHEPVHIDDFYPTILNLAGVALPSAGRLAETPAGVFADGPVKQVLDGQSFKKLLADPATTMNADGSPRTFLWHYPNQWGEGYGAPRNYNFYTVVRQGDWKLIYNHNNHGGAKTFELYNLAEDIGESNDLAASCPEITDRLRKLMGRLLRERGAQMPTCGGRPVPYPDAL